MADHELSARLAGIARDIEARGDIGGAGQQIVNATAELFGASAEAAISIARKKHRVENHGSTSESARHGDELQTELGEGPCLDAVWEHEQVCAGDLLHDERWPTWGPRMAEEHGIRSMLCTQLFTDGSSNLGALNIYSTKPEAFDEEDQEVARLLAAHVALAVAAVQQVDGLKLAVDRRTTIGKALGMIMVKYDLGEDVALSVLNRLSNHENRKLYDVAQEVVRTRGLPGEGRD